MDIVFGNNEIRKKCNKASGKLRQRLDDIHAAANLGVLRSLPGRYHQLRADRSGEWACDLEQPYRLVFRPFADPLPISKDGLLDTTQVFAVVVLEVVNYHER
jgi:proteic killer suppression protein